MGVKTVIPPYLKLISSLTVLGVGNVGTTGRTVGPLCHLPKAGGHPSPGESSIAGAVSLMSLLTLQSRPQLSSLDHILVKTILLHLFQPLPFASGKSPQFSRSIPGPNLLQGLSCHCKN